MSEQPSLSDAAHAACEALRRHAEICARDPDDSTAVMPALVELREAMGAYSRLLTESTGWAPPFSDLDADPSLEAAAEDDGDEATEDGTADLPWIMVSSVAMLRVDDAEGFMDFARSRLGRDTDSPEDAARLLCEADGWKPADYPSDSFTVTQHDVDSLLS